MNNEKYRYKIDPEFRDLIPPLSQNEYEELEKSILSEGCRESIYTWNDYIIDGHNRYEICIKHGLEPPVFSMAFESREEVIIWICSVQLSRRNVTEPIRRYLIGKRYEAEKLIGAHNASGCNQYSHPEKEVRYQSDTEAPLNNDIVRTRDRLGKEYNLASATVYRYGEYAKTIDKIKEHSPNVAKKILNETARVTTRQLISLASKTDNVIQAFCDKINEYPDEQIPYTTTKEIISKYINKPKDPKLPNSVGTIKEMPMYDPDAEIKSLSFTIPSWITSIERLLQSPTNKKASDNSKRRLLSELETLISKSTQLRNKLEEKQDNE